jgi:hypothetical protein
MPPAARSLAAKYKTILCRNCRPDHEETKRGPNRVPEEQTISATKKHAVRLLATDLLDGSGELALARILIPFIIVQHL